MFASRPVLLAIFVCAAFAPAASAELPASGQTIELFSYGFRPGPIALAAGKEVTLKFVDTSGGGHDFTAPEFFAASRIVSGDVKEGEVELKGGESKTVTLVPAAGQYKAHCSHPFHSVMGMHTTIVVR
jgi:plastocyanin